MPASGIWVKRNDVIYHAHAAATLLFINPKYLSPLESLNFVSPKQVMADIRYRNNTESRMAKSMIRLQQSVIFCLAVSKPAISSTCHGRVDDGIGQWRTGGTSDRPTSSLIRLSATTAANTMADTVKMKIRALLSFMVMEAVHAYALRCLFCGWFKIRITTITIPIAMNTIGRMGIRSRNTEGAFCSSPGAAGKCPAPVAIVWLNQIRCTSHARPGWYRAKRNFRYAGRRYPLPCRPARF